MNVSLNIAFVSRPNYLQSVVGTHAVGFGVEEGTVRFGAAVALFAGAGFEERGVELLLLPAVTVGTAVVERTAVSISFNEVVVGPVGTRILVVGNQVGLAAEVLPVVGINAGFFVVVPAEGAPHCFEEIHVEVAVPRHQVQQLDG